MKDLLLIGPLPPFHSYGGPTKSINGLYNLFNRYNIDLSILSPNHQLDGTKIKTMYSDTLIYRKNQSLFLLRNFYKYKIIWLNSFFDVKLLILLFLRLFFKFNLIVSTRGQLAEKAIKTSNKYLKQLFINKVKLFKRFISFHSTSTFETKNIERFFKNVKINEIDNLFALNYKPNYVNKKNFIFYSRIHKKKGLDFLLKTIDKYNLEIELDIYGFIEDITYWKICEKYINKLSGVNYCGELSDGDITALQNKYSYFILPTLNENFGHVIIELLSIGCIPIISKTNPFDSEINEIFNLNFDLNSHLELNQVLQKATSMLNEKFFNLKSKVKPYYKKLEKNQEETKKKYLSFIHNIN